MYNLISENIAASIVTNYLSQLYAVGYVKSGDVKKMIAYLFLIDFVAWTHSYITEEDYKKIERMLSVLFSGGNCLLPYPVFCTNRMKLGSTDYDGSFILRKTEVDDQNRITEDENFRTV